MRPALLRARRSSRPVLVLTLLVLCWVGLAPAGPASAASGCPRADRSSNLVVVTASQTSVTFPGARSADFCGAPADLSRTQLWVDPSSPRAHRWLVAGVGTWTARSNGQLTFSPLASYRQRPRGDTGPGHDAIMKYAIVDQKGTVRSGIADAYVLYRGASAFSDAIDTCQGSTVRPLANDVAGWKGDSTATAAHATWRPDTLRLGGGQDGVRETPQGTWRRQSGGRVGFTPASGWDGRSASVGYSVQDSFGNTATSTITARSCKATSATPSSASPSSSASNAGSDGQAGGQHTSAPDGSSGGGDSHAAAWVPLGLAAVCLVVGLVALRRRRNGEA